MTKRMLIDALHPDEMRVVIADEKQIYDFDFISAAKKQVKGNIYLAKITRVEPSLQAAFVEYGGGKQGFLPFSEIHADYYQIPMSDRRRLMEESEREDDSSDDDTETAAPDTQDAAPASESQDISAPAEDFALPDIPEITLPAGMESYDDVDAGVPLPLQPALEEIPIGDENASPAEESSADAEAPARTEKARSLTFATSEIVEQETLENEELAGRFAIESGDSSEGSEPRESQGNKSEGVETLEDEISPRPKRNQFHKRYKIQEVIKRGQIVLVQVIKDERGNKGVSLTTYLSLPGRYCVLMPNSPKDGGVSRKISDGDTRKRLKEVMAELKLARGMSVIIRTAGIDRTRAEIRRDFDYLVKLWNQIRDITLQSTAPALIYEESDLIKRAIRDQYTSDIAELIVEGDDAYTLARDFMKMLLPSHTPRVKHYKDAMPLFYAYGVEDQLMAMHEPVVKLKSGGYIVINPTEALISIDVNSGRATSERNIEETATKTNLEAAAEVARQLRLRDLAGLIVIDFIDMMESRNRRNVERALKDSLKSDRAKIQLGRISPFGLLEMSRQRLRPSIAESSSIQCPHCMGRGNVRSNESLSIQIVRSLEKEASTGNWHILKLNATESVALHMLNNKRPLLAEIEQRYGVTITIAIDHGYTLTQFTIEKSRKGGGRQNQEERSERSERNESRRGGRDRDRDRGGRQRPAELLPVEPENEHLETEETSEYGEGESSSDNANRNRDGRRRRGRRGGRGRNNRRDENGAPMQAETNGNVVEPVSFDDEDANPGNEAAPAIDGEQERAPSDRARRGRRGGRGRRRWKDGERPEGQSQESAEPGGAPAPQQNFAADPRPAYTPPRDAEALPSFTREPVVIQQPSRPELVVSHLQNDLNSHVSTQPLESTSRPDGTPPRKGWWQRMIELD